MKKRNLLLTGLLAMTISIMPIYAAKDNSYSKAVELTADNTFKLGDLSSSSVKNIDSSNVGYRVGGDYVCYSCGIYIKTVAGKPVVAGANIASPGIGVYFKNGKTWETGSFPGPYESTKGSYPLSSFFVGAYVGDPSSFSPDKKAEDFINNFLLANNSGTSLEKEYSNVKITVTPELMENKNFVKLNYKVKNNSTTAQTVNIATFNDIYLGGVPTAICNDNAAYKLNNSLPTITTGFNALTTNKYMTVILEETSGLLSNGGGAFKYWAGNHTSPEMDDSDDTYPVTLSNIVANLFNSGGIPSSASPYSDSEFVYSWSKSVDAGEEVTFSTLIGLGNLEEPTVDITNFSPNYNSDDKVFNITTDNKEIHIGGTITDKCGMGTCTYTINGEGPYNCDDETYYTDGSFKSPYSTTISTDKLSNQNENTFEVTATSVACGTAKASTTFNLPKDQTPNKKTGIDSNYIALGVILLGGVALFIYSRRQNKFPQV